MLTTVIVCALLINFSFTITREIIGLTNGAAQAFYSALDMNNSKNNLNYRLKAAFFEPAEKAGGQTAVSDVTAHSLERIPGNSLSEIAVNGFGIIAILLIASFVFIAAGVLFLYRTVSLLFALVLSPLAFVAPVVPKFENRSSQYWNWLIQQSLFAPAVMFCFILVYAIAAPGSVTLPQGALTIAGFDLIKSAAIISFIKFILIAGTLLGSLLVAKAMGAAGVGVANKIAHGTMNYLGAGSAGLARVAGGQKAIDFARRKAGQAGEAIQTSDSIAAKALRFMPGGKRVGAALGAQARGQVADYEKSLANLSSNALKRRMSMGTISALEKAAITNVLAGRGDLKPGTGLKEGMVTGGAIPTLQQISGDAKKIEKLDWQYATNPTERAGAVPNIKPENIEKLKANEYFDGAASSQNVRQAMYSGFHGGHMDSIISHPDPNVNRQFFANLRNDLVRTVNPNTGTPFKNSVSDLVTYLTDARIGIKGNRLAGWAQSQVGENMLKANGFS